MVIQKSYNIIMLCIEKDIRNSLNKIKLDVEIVCKILQKREKEWEKKEREKTKKKPVDQLSPQSSYLLYILILYM